MEQIEKNAPQPEKQHSPEFGRRQLEVSELVENLRNIQRGRKLTSDEIRRIKDAIDNPTGRYEH